MRRRSTWLVHLKLYSKTYSQLFKDAFAVHYGGGLVGLLFTPVFMTGGIVDWKKGDPMIPFQVWCWNLVGLIAITLWSGVICGLMFFALSKAGLLRLVFNSRPELTFF